MLPPPLVASQHVADSQRPVGVPLRDEVGIRPLHPDPLIAHRGSFLKTWRDWPARPAVVAQFQNVTLPVHDGGIIGGKGGAAIAASSMAAASWRSADATVIRPAAARQFNTTADMNTVGSSFEVYRCDPAPE